MIITAFTGLRLLAPILFGGLQKVKKQPSVAAGEYAVIVILQNSWWSTFLRSSNGEELMPAIIQIREFPEARCGIENVKIPWRQQLAPNILFSNDDKKAGD